jgi:hypothetical protein
MIEFHSSPAFLAGSSGFVVGVFLAPLPGDFTGKLKRRRVNGD